MSQYQFCAIGSVFVKKIKSECDSESGYRMQNADSLLPKSTYVNLMIGAKGKDSRIVVMKGFSWYISNMTILIRIKIEIEKIGHLNKRDEVDQLSICPSHGKQKLHAKL